jgi:hypothetical protein
LSDRIFPPSVTEFLVTLKQKRASGVTDKELKRAVEMVKEREIYRMIESAFRGKGLAFIDECLEVLSRPAPATKTTAKYLVRPANRMQELYPDE